MLPLGVVRTLDLGGPGAKKGDLVMGPEAEFRTYLGAMCPSLLLDFVYKELTRGVRILYYSPQPSRHVSAQKSPYFQSPKSKH
jgi:hypothetical protein